MDWAAASQGFFLRKLEEAARARGRPPTERELEILLHGFMGSFESNAPPEPGFRRRIVRLLNEAYEADLKAHEARTSPWKHFGHPKLVWMRNLRNWYPPPVNELRAAVEQWALERFGELKLLDYEPFGGM